MDVGIAFPNAVPGASGEQLIEWARRADARGFSTLGAREDDYEFSGGGLKGRGERLDAILDRVREIWAGEQIAAMIAGAAAKDADTVKQYVGGYEQAGCDELVFCPASSDPAQVDLLADAVGL